MRLLPLLAATVSVAALIGSSSAMAQQRHHGSSAHTPDFVYEPSVRWRADKDGRIEGRFGRMFALNKPYNEHDHTLTPHPSPVYDLRWLGRDDGPMEEADGDAAGDGNAPAGITFFGQFVDHDITLDVTTKLDKPAIPEQIQNRRTINLDLDCIYGAGPEASPYLYDLPKLVVGDEIGGSGRHDLARFNDVALIGDPRNDENVVVSQLQAAFIAFHNKVVDALIADKRLDPTTLNPHQEREIFEEARDHVIHYYHRLLVEDFLPQVIGVQLTVHIAQNGRKFYFPEGFYDNANNKIQEPYMPIEFSVAAYRFGHSQVRQAYSLNDDRQDVPLFHTRNDETNDPGLMGFRPIAEQNVIDWRYFFAVDENDHRLQKARRIDTLLPSHLFTLQNFGIVNEDDLGSLAARNLNRGRTYRLPSGQDLAKRMELAVTEADNTVKKTLAIEKTPLWYYILQEASQFEAGWSKENHYFVARAGGQDVKLENIRTDASKTIKLTDEQKDTGDFGNILGPVGGTIVGEVIGGLIDHYRETTGKGLDFVPDPEIVDAIGSKETENYGRRVQMQHVLRFAGVL